MIGKADEVVEIFRQLNPENQELVLTCTHLAQAAENSVRKSLGGGNVWAGTAGRHAGGGSVGVIKGGRD
ncbi:hypothetical protein ACYULU_11325 [Breznakiellaceae bacterium SP9]